MYNANPHRGAYSLSIEATEEYERSYFFTSGDVTMILADPYGDGAYIEISADSQ